MTETEKLICQILEDKIPEDHPVTGDEILDAELYVMDAIAIKRAGGEHMVHWEACQLYQ